MVRYSDQDYYYLTPEVDLEVPLRSYRRSMKPLLPRKASSTARINLNRFWNEMEEFYDRRPQRGEGKEAALPEYTTDTWDHRREAAENAINEKRERMARKDQEVQTEESTDTANTCQRLRLESYDLSNQEYYSSSEEEDEEYDDEGGLDSGFCTSPIALWNLLEPSSESTTTTTLPQPPSTLPRGLAELVAAACKQ